MNPGPFAALRQPPLEQGVAHLARWATRLLGLCVQALTDQSDVLRAMLLQRACKLLGRLQPKAQRSFDALTLRKLRLHRDFDLDTERPASDDDLAAHAWAFVRMTRLLHTAAVDPGLGDDVDSEESAASAAAYWRLFDALSAYEKLNADSAIEELRQALEAEA